MIVIGRETEDAFCEKLADELTKLNGDEEAVFYPVEHRHHPDGETLPRLTDGPKDPDEITRLRDMGDGIKKLPPSERSFYKPPNELIKRVRNGEKALVIGRGKAGKHWDPNDVFMDSLLLSGELRDRCRKAEICVVWPYYPYSRQHDRYIFGQPHSAKLVRKAITDNRRFADMLITVSAHNYRTTGEMDGNCWNLDATPAVIEYAKTIGFLDDRYLVTCDSGQSLGELRFPLAEAINAGTVALRKERDRLEGDVRVHTKVMEDMEHPEKTSLLYYDDELATGGTLYKHISRVIGLGFLPENIHVVVVAAKDNPNKKLGKYGAECINELGVNLAASDTIESPYARFSVTSILAKYIQETFW